MIGTLLSSRRLSDGQWQQVLDDALLARRAMVHSATGFSPARLVLGEEIVMPEALAAAPTWQRWRKAGLLDGTVEQQRQGAADADQKRQKQRAKDFDAVLQAMDKAAVRPGRGPDGGGNAAGLGSKFKPGSYVRRWLGDDLTKDDEVLNAKLAPRRWSTPWRICELVRGVAAIITKADDPLQVATVSVHRLKPVWLTDEQMAQYEALWRRTMAQKAQLKRARDVVLERGDEWEYEDEDDREWQTVERIIQVRGKGRSKQARVEWKNGATTWEPAKVIKKDAPLEWKRWKTENAKRNDEEVEVKEKAAKKSAKKKELKKVTGGDKRRKRD
jgi:hypothetical protein